MSTDNLVNIQGVPVDVTDERDVVIVVPSDGLRCMYRVEGPHDFNVSSYGVVSVAVRTAQGEVRWYNHNASTWLHTVYYSHADLMMIHKEQQQQADSN